MLGCAYAPVCVHISVLCLCLSVRLCMRVRVCTYMHVYVCICLLCECMHVCVCRGGRGGDLPHCHSWVTMLRSMVTRLPEILISCDLLLL